MTTFLKRKLEATFVLGKGAFGMDGGDTVKVGNLRMSAQIRKAGGHAMGHLDLTVWGMTASVMNQLSTLGFAPLTYKLNSVTLSAASGEDDPPSVVFQGQIIDAYIDVQGAPDAAFRISANTGLFQAVQPTLPISFTGEAQVADIMSGIATQMGLKFENNGVSNTLSNAYYYGSPRVQAQKVVDDADIEWNNGDDGVLAIWPRGGSRNGGLVLIDPDHGMIGYPAFSPTGIIVKTLYNPSISMGNQIEVKSSFQKALDRANAAQKPADKSKWVVISIDHDLDAQVPQGQWFSTINAAPLGYGPVPVR